jgi:hypothetical protein
MREIFSAGGYRLPAFFLDEMHQIWIVIRENSGVVC